MTVQFETVQLEYIGNCLTVLLEYINLHTCKQQNPYNGTCLVYSVWFVCVHVCMCVYEPPWDISHPPIQWMLCNPIMSVIMVNLMGDRWITDNSWYMLLGLSQLYVKCTHEVNSVIDLQGQQLQSTLTLLGLYRMVRDRVPAANLFSGSGCSRVVGLL